jgi:hypothetical protein
MPFPIDPSNPWKYRNCAISKQTCPSYSYELPDDFFQAKERFIVIRQARATFGLTTQPGEWLCNDFMLMSDLATEHDLATCEIDRAFGAGLRPFGFICLCNDPNTKKKRYKYDWSYQTIHFAFARIDGLPTIPTQWLVDFLLVFR